MKLQPNPWLRKHLDIKDGEYIDLDSISMLQMGEYYELYVAYLKE